MLCSKTLKKIGRLDLCIFVALGMTSFLFSNCAEEIGLRLASSIDSLKI